MHQFVVWTALSLEGVGCNLQHYNFNPSFTEDVLSTWDLPKTWSLKAQNVFGTPKNGMTRDRERTYKPLNGRIMLVGE